MWASVRYFGVIISSVSLLTAMLEDAPNEMGEVLEIPWYFFYESGRKSTEKSCLHTELGPDYAHLFERIKKNFKTFHDVNRTAKRVREDVVEEINMSLTQLVAHRGFDLEVHNVSVGDGWTVTVHRIVPAKVAVPGLGSSQADGSSSSRSMAKAPVLVPSFLLGSSGFWLTAGRNTSLVYILADGGFDVWLGNYRGNSLYARHERTNYSEETESPWAFTVNDHALYDTPAQIDYILAVTGQPKLHLVGMSQGSISTIQMLSLRPEYNNKVLAFASLAGARSLTSADQLPFIKYIVCLVANHLKPDEILPWDENFASLVQGAEDEGFQLVKDLIGMTPHYADLSKLSLWLKYLPGGTSTWALRYYHDLWNSSKIRMDNSSKAELVQTFDYGPRGNMRRFNSESPIMMNVEHLKVPTKVYFSSGDLYCTAEENWKLVNSLPANTTEYLFIDDLNYSHYNFALNDRDPSVFYDVLNFLRKNEISRN
ncbi:lipase member K-like [Tropilaelaps mercedesae]|uniref:Lipase member K-like n=1 Tax=Tropilaelaps mercedesae TaxID=418985 RepID=A0A1V9XSK1_9ACAR|nr:lipase member K-like [Tropilaelaps mercedesae]